MDETSFDVTDTSLGVDVTSLGVAIVKERGVAERRDLGVAMRGVVCIDFVGVEGANEEEEEEEVEEGVKGTARD